ncbi:MAG: hypothetical protein GY820_08405 [Gammaproteobacteria bacterium]|nr:hypothetical protein [Gammaproteobacteria bacterium]
MVYILVSRDLGSLVTSYVVSHELESIGSRSWDVMVYTLVSRDLGRIGTSYVVSRDLGRIGSTRSWDVMVIHRGVA